MGETRVIVARLGLRILAALSRKDTTAHARAYVLHSRYASTALVGNEVAEVVGEYAEQRQSRNSIRSQDPEVASFKRARLGVRG